MPPERTAKNDSLWHQAFSAEAATDFVDSISAFFSWSVAPVYIALIAMYFIAVVNGWVNALAIIPRAG